MLALSAQSKDKLFIGGLMKPEPLWSGLDQLFRCAVGDPDGSHWNAPSQIELGSSQEAYLSHRLDERIELRAG